jgi:cytoskeletal protein RodZ
MTTRDETRHATELRTDVARGIGNGRPLARGRGRQAAPAEERPPGLAERLYEARERKGVDLYRAERDTKIRARYLGALERGDWKALPGTVYTKGFLRNYALYLGLDPDEVLLAWRLERGESRESEPIVVPRPIAAPRQGLMISPNLIVAILLLVLVGVFAVYLGTQLLRFARPPTIAVTAPAVAMLEVEEGVESYTLRGTSIPGATIEVTDPGIEREIRASADGSGNWSIPVDLRRGQNSFTVTAIDPETGKEAETAVTVLITVPFAVVEAPTLTVESPADGARFENGAIPVQGRTTNAARVSVAAEYLGPPEAGAPAASAGPSASPVASSPAPPSPVTVDVESDGSFTTPLELTEGRWQIEVTAQSEEGKTSSLRRNVTVAFEGVNLVVAIDGGSAWLKVWLDGQLAENVGAAGRTYRDGQTMTFSADDSIEVRTGSSGVTKFTLNGTSLGALGPSGIPETWLFAPPAEPEQTERR